MEHAFILDSFNISHIDLNHIDFGRSFDYTDAINMILGPTNPTNSHIDDPGF